jgi:hypothetical protein
MRNKHLSAMSFCANVAVTRSLLVENWFLIAQAEIDGILIDNVDVAHLCVAADALPPKFGIIPVRVANATWIA